MVTEAGEPRPFPSSPGPDLRRLLAPRSVVVVGATDRAGSYAAQTLLNLRRSGFTGPLAGVHPRQADVLGVACRPDLSGALDLIGAPADAVVVATTAATVPDYLTEAGRLGCGGAVVFAGGFAEAGDLPAEQRLVAAAGRYGLPTLGPDTGGLVSSRARACLWRDPVTLPGPAEPDTGIALITESSAVGRRALAHRGGTGLHTVVSLGNGAVVDAALALTVLATTDGVRAIALYLEQVPPGARLASALAVCADAGVRLAVLRTGRRTGDSEVLDALLHEAGAVPCADVHQLIETTRALAQGRRSRKPVAVITTCTSDAALAEDLAAGAGIELAALQATTRLKLRSHLPRTMTPSNPLHHTTQLHADTLDAVAAAVAADPGVGTVVYVHDEPDVPPLRLNGDIDVLVVAAMPGQEPAGAVSGLPAALAALAQLRQPPPDATRLDRIAAFAQIAEVARTAAPTTPARTRPGSRHPFPAEHSMKAVLDTAGIDVLRHAVVPVPPSGSDPAAVATAVALAAAQIGFPVTLRLSSPGPATDPEPTGLTSLTSGDRVSRRVAGLLREADALDAESRCDAALLIEARARPGLPLTMTAHRRGAVPALTVGLGGPWAQVPGSTRTVPLPADPERVTRAAASLPGTATADLAAAGRAGHRLGELLVEGHFAHLRITLTDGTAVSAQARQLPPP
ncbi:CoA-binding protein [Kineosporia sp. NBRC 101731]|uniref:CoA-binding protein n=1 Tax=Kineosporia sp. NBRC 101731 TaxID=3032199 RepID=UPI0024A16C98|nr:CoA-binding protein [Kineosporia sp. NBRC 101731]GLY31721.1 CoA-binding protein [Kineosporia sp. NBRC 101731]